MEALESAFGEIVGWLELILEIAGAAFVAIGAVAAVALLARAMAAPGAIRFTPVRLQFAKYLSLALEFQLAADILGTTIAPTWQQIGQLGAVAVTRTGLNYFLAREMREERETIADEEAVRRGAVESRASRPEPSSP